LAKARRKVLMQSSAAIKKQTMLEYSERRRLTTFIQNELDSYDCNEPNV